MNTSSHIESALTLRDRFKTATRGAILEAAASSFASDGATGVRMEDIAARAGISVGTLYNYFQDRSSLVGALLELRMRAMLDGLDAQHDADAPFRQRLGRFVQALADHFEANRSLLSVLLEDASSHGHDGRATSRGRSVLREVLTRAERLLADGVHRGVLREGDPTVYAALLVGMVRGMVWSALARKTGLADAAPEIVAVFLNGAGRR